jgi:hypothetical protein
MLMPSRFPRILQVCLFLLGKEHPPRAGQYVTNPWQKRTRSVRGNKSRQQCGDLDSTGDLERRTGRNTAAEQKSYPYRSYDMQQTGLIEMCRTDCEAAAPSLIFLGTSGTKLHLLPLCSPPLL